MNITIQNEIEEKPGYELSQHLSKYWMVEKLSM